MMTLHTRLHDARGFSLIELLIVIIIVGFFIAIGIPLFKSFGNAGHDLATGLALDNAVHTLSHAATPAGFPVGQDAVAVLTGKEGKLKIRLGTVNDAQSHTIIVDRASTSLKTRLYLRSSSGSVEVARLTFLHKTPTKPSVVIDYVG